MGIKYELADDIMARIYDIVRTLSEDHSHVRLSGVYCIRSYGSQSRRTIARCYALGKIWQLALGIRAVYLIEVICERFNKLSKEEQDKVLIHELMHIPKTFGGGFKHHDYVTDSEVEKMYRKYLYEKEKNENSKNWF